MSASAIDIRLDEYSITSSAPLNRGYVLRQLVEAKLRKIASAAPQIIDSVLLDEIQRSVREMSAYQIELEMQNDRLRRMHREQEALQARYLNLYDAAPVGYCTVSQSGQILEANLTAASLLSVNHSVLITKKIHHFILDSDQDNYSLLFKKLLVNSNSATSQLQMVKLDGSIFWAQLTVNAVQHDDGDPVIRIVLADITDARLVEARTSAIQSKLQATLDAIPDLLFELGLDGRYYDYHSPRSELLAAPAAELIGKRVADVLPPMVANVVIAALHEANESGFSSGKQFELELSQGHKWFELSVSRKSFSPGDGARFIVLSRDITKRKLAELALFASERRYHSVVAALSEGVVLRARNGKILTWNDAAERILGLSSEQMRGLASREPGWKFVHENDSSFSSAIPPGLEVLQTGMPQSNVVMGIQKLNSIITWVSINAVPIFNQDDPLPSAVVVSFSDVTEQKKMNLERINYLKKLDKASRHLMTAQAEARRGLSCELHDRTSSNLAAININLSLIANAFSQEPSPELQERLDDTRALIMDTNASIRDICAEMRPPLLDYAGLSAALDGYIRQFSRRTGIALKFDGSNCLERFSPELESLLFRVCQEALTNCAKHAEATSVWVSLSKCGYSIELVVTDNGIGFDPALLGQDKLVGIGLLNMQEMAEMAGGRFFIDSAPGKGTCIAVKFRNANKNKQVLRSRLGVKQIY